MSYGCHNRPRPSGYYFAPDGYATVSKGYGRTADTKPGMRTITRKDVMPVHKLVRNSFADAPCKYDQNTTDPKCKGCRHVTTPAQ